MAPWSYRLSVSTRCFSQRTRAGSKLKDCIARAGAGVAGGCVIIRAKAAWERMSGPERTVSGPERATSMSGPERAIREQGAENERLARAIRERGALSLR